MKCSYLFKFFTGLLFISQSVNAQDQNPSVSGAGAFEEYPVELYTGAPKVNVPIYSMPTRSKDVSIDLSLDYHPSSVSEFNKGMGNAGRGWTLNYGGVIGRNIVQYPDEKGINSGWNSTSIGPYSDDYYYFNFCGYSGKFKVSPYGQGYMTEGAGPVLKMDVIYDSVTPSNIAAIKFYDDKGFSYTFAAVDKVMAVVSDSPGDAQQLINNSFQMTEIRDNNNQVLVTYDYYNIHPNQGPTTFRTIKDITVPGYGKLHFTPYNLSSSDWAIINDVVVTDVLGHSIKKFVFTYTSEYPNYYFQLAQLDIFAQVNVTTNDFEDTEIQSYKMYYSDPAGFPNTLVYGDESTDRWGYPNHKPFGFCVYYNEYFYIAERYGVGNMKAMTDPDFCYKGVLEKMMLPTGGCIIYEYEANAYSYVDNNLITNQADYDLFTSLSFAQSDHNYTKDILLSSINLNGTFEVVPVGGATVYIEFKGDPYTVSGLDGGSRTPHFWIKNQVGVQVFPASGVHEGSGCNGISVHLDKGVYTLASDGTTGKVKISIRTLKDVPEKSWLGGGIRIKRIGYFAQDNVPQDHYHHPLTITPAIPAREISFGYNLFEDPTRSSGNLKWTDIETKQDYSDVVRYKNVTVKDTKTGGRTEFTFVNEDDYNDEYGESFFKTSNLLNKKIYDEAGNLQLESQYTYTSELPPMAITYPGWSGISQVINLQHFPSGIVETKEEYTYNANKNISERWTYTSRSGDVQKLKYFYHSGNSIYSKNRISEVERVEQYLNDDLLSVAKTIYSDVWNNLANTAVVNKSYLPQQVQSARGNNTLETKSRVNLYDEYGHPLEVQTENGTKKCMIWGYNNTLVIAEIENIAYNAIPTTLVTDAQTYSNGPVGTLTEAQTEAELLNKLNALRNAPQLANAFVTTYTYKPLVGVLSVTDSRGYMITTEYDTSNRPVFVKDQEGNILTENQYHNKQN